MKAGFTRGPPPALLPTGCLYDRGRRPRLWPSYRPRAALAGLCRRRVAKFSCVAGCWPQSRQSADSAGTRFARSWRPVGRPSQQGPSPGYRRVALPERSHGTVVPQLNLDREAHQARRWSRSAREGEGGSNTGTKARSKSGTWTTVASAWYRCRSTRRQTGNADALRGRRSPIRELSRRALGIDRGGDPRPRLRAAAMAALDGDSPGSCACRHGRRGRRP